MRKEILETLMNNKERYISGEDLSQRFGVSRTAVWKAIKQLKEQGYQIESVSRKGYKLLETALTLNADELAIAVKADGHSYHFICEKTVDSTSILLKSLANKGAEEWTIVIAEEQASGKGRLGRHWVSKAGEGIYMSLLLKPEIQPYHAPKITQIAASAITLAIREQTNLPALIKWPNDIVVTGKKVCGILTEMSAELNQINHVILGIGINVNGLEIEPSIEHKATSLRKAMDTHELLDRKSLIKNFYKYFEQLYAVFLETKSATAAIEICRQHSAIIGQNVQILRRNQREEVHVLDITEDGELLVRHEDGTEEIVISGEVSIRRGQDYI